MRRRVLVTASVLAVLSALRAAAQNLEVFELETFVDPATLAVPRDDGTAEELTLFAAYLRLGATNDYQYRTRFTGSDVTFSDLTATWMRNRRQATVRVTGLENDAGTGGYRLEARLATYRHRPPSTEGASGTITRWEGFVLRQQDTGVADGTTLGVRLDLSAIRSAEVVGGLTYAFYQPDPNPTRIVDANVHFVSADFRTNVWRPGESFSVDLGGGVGATVQEGVSEWGTLRGELRLKWRPNNDRLRVYAVYGPAWQIRKAAGSNRRTNHEVTVFAHVRLLTMLVARRAPAAEPPAAPPSGT